MTRKKSARVTSKPSKTRCPRAEGSREKLAEAFLADLDRSWREHGREALERVRVERPKVYFRVLLKLTLALHRALDKLSDVDRRPNREEVLERLEQSR